ncbi:MAG: methyltransferase domain-containing protein [Betaproteobacteria bacterium]
MTAAADHARTLAALARDARVRPHDARVQLALGQTLQHLGRPLEALAAYERANALAPTLGPAWTLRGHLLRQAGRLADASVCFERAIACGEDEASHCYFLGALGLGALPEAAPPAFVRALFDEYAEGFEGDLVDTLHYRGHLQVCEPLAALHPRPFASALDLGCGSGLAAPLLRPLATRLAGVDLAPRMIAAAGATGLYDELQVSELLAHLHATTRRHDLVVACDVFIYLGNLAPVFDAVARVLEEGGVFAFSVEAGDAEGGYDLLPTLRYTHSEPYLRGLAQAHGLRVTRCERAPLRESQGEAITGLVMHLVRD